jgi:hypothetical protein
LRPPLMFSFLSPNAEGRKERVWNHPFKEMPALIDGQVTRYLVPPQSR